MICYCGKICSNYSLNTLVKYKKLNTINNNIISIIWELYKLNKYYSVCNYLIFKELLKKILKVILKYNCEKNNDLIFYVINAYLLKNKRDKIMICYNFNYELYMLLLDFYFATINLSDFALNIRKWINNIYINEPYIIYLYLYRYRYYLRLMDYNINIDINMFYNKFEIIINNF
jgi:hypothetical protein